jgi:hypothetical protein
MATKKLAKRASKSIANDECRPKIACEHNIFNLIDATQQSTLYATSQAGLDEQTEQQVPQPIHAEDEGEIKLKFAPQRYIVYNKFRGAALIHIREYAVKTASCAVGVCEYPTKKGVCFTPGRLFMLRSKLDEIDNQLKLQQFPNPQPSPAYKQHIGGAVFVSTGQGFNCVDLRRHFIPEGKSTITPTKCGIALSPNQWNSMKEKLQELLALHPELESAMPCMHDAQEEMMQCRECMPFGWMTLSV